MVPCSAFFLPSQGVRKNVPSFLTAFLWPPGGSGDFLEKELLDGLDRMDHIGDHCYSPPSPSSIVLEVPQISANGVTVYGVLFFFGMHYDRLDLQRNKCAAVATSRELRWVQMSSWPTTG